MLSIGGELAFILQDIEYGSKKELLEKLKTLKDSLKSYPKDEKQILKPIFEVSFQQAIHTSEWELMRYKNFCEFRRKHERTRNN